MSSYGVVLVHTTSAAVRSEKALLHGGIAVKLIPTPREFSGNCGIAVCFPWQQAEIVRMLLNEARVDVSGIHKLPGSD